ncbi:MAG: hypothetical protein ABI413_21865 [Ktedonobacteraceae bacterium]
MPDTLDTVINAFTQRLDYREARKRYTPHVVACTCCDTLVYAPLERVEQLCQYCLYACGRGRLAEQAQRRIVRLLERRIQQKKV